MFSSTRIPRHTAASRGAGLTLSRLILACGVGSLGVSSALQAQLPIQVADRGSLVEPVYRPTTDAPADAAADPAPAEVKAENGTKVALATPSHAATADLASEVAKERAPREVMQEAITDAQSMLTHIQATVKDYTCVLIKRENVRGTVVPTEFIYTKVRNRRKLEDGTEVPFSVYMQFLKPEDCKGREVLYVENERNGSLLVKEGGLKGKFLPTVTLAPSGHFAMLTNRYPISELGIENLTRRLLDRSTTDRDIDVCKIKYCSGAKVNGRPCKVLEVVRPTPKTGDAVNYGMNVFLAQVFIDEEWNVPVRYGAYDWPASEGATPEVVEEYTYHNLKLNVGLKDEDFSAKNRKYKF